MLEGKKQYFDIKKLIGKIYDMKCMIKEINVYTIV